MQRLSKPIQSAFCAVGDNNSKDDESVVEKFGRNCNILLAIGKLHSELSFELEHGELQAFRSRVVPASHCNTIFHYLTKKTQFNISETRPMATIKCGGNVNFPQFLPLQFFLFYRKKNKSLRV